MKQQGLAERTFKEAIDADPTDARTWLKLGVFLQHKNDLESAEQCYIKSLQCNATATNTECMRRYAGLLDHIGQKQQARQLLQAARLHHKVASSKRHTVFENERKQQKIYSKDNLTRALDFRGAWSTKEGVPKPSKDKIEPVPGWEWVESEWMLDAPDNLGDHDGWRYAANWNSSEWKSVDDSTCHVRRRCWERTETKRRSLAYEKVNLKTFSKFSLFLLRKSKSTKK